MVSIHDSETGRKADVEACLLYFSPNGGWIVFNPPGQTHQISFVYSEPTEISFHCHIGLVSNDFHSIGRFIKLKVVRYSSSNFDAFPCLIL